MNVPDWPEYTIDEDNNCVTTRLDGEEYTLRSVGGDLPSRESLDEAVWSYGVFKRQQEQAT